MKSSLLEILAEREWDIDDVLSSKENRNLAVVELSRMESYIEGLKEANKILSDILREKNSIINAQYKNPFETIY